MVHDDATAEGLLVAGLTEGNMLQFLACIEKRVSEIAQMVNATKAGHTLASLSHAADVHRNNSARAGASSRATTTDGHGYGFGDGDFFGGGVGGGSSSMPPRSRSHGSSAVITPVLEVGGSGGVAGPLVARNASQLPVALGDVDDGSDSDPEEGTCFVCSSVAVSGY
jgi:hypothetical protein